MTNLVWISYVFYGSKVPALFLELKSQVWHGKTLSFGVI